MAMTTEDWVITTNFLVAGTSILVAAATEHDAIKAMRDTTLSLIRAIAHINNPKAAQDAEEDESK